MKCEELRSRISEGMYTAHTAAVQHLEVCSECRALAHADQALRQCLAAVRDSAPEIPASLDAPVMAAYRARVAEKTRASGRMWMLRPLIWSAVAASLVIATVLLVVHRKTATPTNVVTVRKPSAPVVPSESQGSPERVSQKLAVAPRRVIRRAHPRVQSPKSSATVAAARTAPNNGFQNLMFCDPLSCPGPMQVIRIQVPAAAMNRVPAWRPTGGMVQADVVVGSDGIARAIRIVR